MRTTAVNELSAVTIQKIADSGLCTGCGTCYGICPHEAVDYDLNEKKGLFEFHVSAERCKRCRLCLNSCPGQGVDFSGMNKSLFNTNPEFPLLGCVNECYRGYATDGDLRYKASSGGITTALLKFALQSGFADGAIVTGCEFDNPLVSRPFIAHSVQELEAAAGSKYCPTPANIMLNHVMKDGGRYILVGLPCHIHGVRKAQRMVSQLNQRIVLTISLFCGMNFTYRHIQWLVRNLGIANKKINSIRYRGYGFPGDMSITTEESTVSCSYREYFINAFKLPRCTICPDTFGELSDISIGDAWLPEHAHERNGLNVVIERTPVGREIIQKAIGASVVHLEQLSQARVIKTNERIAIFKKNNEARCQLYRFIYGGIPDYHSPKANIPVSHLVDAVRYYLNIGLRGFLFENMPRWALRGCRQLLRNGKALANNLVLRGRS